MKNLFKTGLLALLALALFGSCSDDDSYEYRYYFSYGNVVAIDDNIENGYNIVRDDGTILQIYRNFVRDEEVEDGDRVYAQYSIIGTQTGSNNQRIYTVDLYGLSEILVKDPIPQSEINASPDPEATEESLGDDPIKVTYATVGGRYLTVEFWIYTKRGSDLQHLINLVWDNTRVPENPDDKTAYLTLRHNGYDQVPEPGTNMREYVKTVGSISFDITSILPAGVTSVPIRLIWTEYGATLGDREQYYKDYTFSYNPGQQPERRGVDISYYDGQASPTYTSPLLIK